MQQQKVTVTPFTHEEDHDWDAFDDHTFTTPTDINNLNTYEQPV